MFENDQMFSGEVGLLVLTVIPILVAALVGLAILVRRENAAVIDDPGNASRLDNQSELTGRPRMRRFAFCESWLFAGNTRSYSANESC